MPRLEACEDRVLLAAFIVNDAADTITGAGNDGTLRYVITQLNASADPSNTVSFNIGGGGLATITLGSDLPAIVRPATIDGYTQSGSAVNTASTGTNAVINVQLNLNGHAGLSFGAGSANSSLRGLSIYAGSGPAVSIGDNNVTVAGNFLGVQADGTTGSANGSGISVASGVTSATIGSTAPADRNLISGNTSGAGIALAGSSATVRGNLIGTTRSGTAGLANQFGLDITGPNHVVGGTAAGQGNVIAFNSSAAVRVDTGTGNAIRGNSIFGPATGIVLANGGNLNQAAPSIEAYAYNSGTRIQGTFIAAASTTYQLDIYTANATDPTAPGGTFVTTQSITTDAAGSATLNFALGTTLPLGARVTATATSPANNTSAFAATATVTAPFVVVNTSDAGPGSLRQAILNANLTSGTDTVMFAIPGSAPFTIAPGSNLPNITDVIVIDGTSQSGYAGQPIVRLQGNAGLGDGLVLAGGSGGSTIKGLNIFGFASGAGVRVTTAGNAIQSNYLGTDAAGGAAGPGNLNGVVITGSGNTLGGLSNVGNLISGNTGAGVLVTGASATSNLIQGNTIGGNLAASAAVANQGGGILVQAGASGNTIGLTSGGAGAGNTIAFNTGAGVTIDAGNGDAIRQNAVFRNTGAGIVLANSGNNNQAAPVLSSAFAVAAGTAISGTVGGLTNGIAYVVEYFASGSGDNTATDQARIFLGNQTFTAAGTTQALSFTSGTSIPIGRTVTATITSASGDTSAFAAARSVESPFVVTTTADSGPGSLRQAILNANATPGTDTISFSIGGASPFLISPASALPTITEPVVIDGTTQSGFVNGAPPVVRIGGNAGLGDGIVLAAGSAGSTIKGLNIFGFASGAGVLVQTDGNTIQGNYLGTDAAGTSAGPGNQRGVAIAGNNNVIGGTSTGAPNVFAFNTSAGVDVDSGSGNAIRQNPFFSNPGLAIDLAPGANGGQAAPVVTAATAGAGTTTVSGTVNSPGAGVYTFDVFAGNSGSPTDARTLLGSATVNFASAGSQPFTVNVSVAATLGQFVTVTATGPAGNTSPFSNSFLVGNPLVVTTAADSGPGSLRQAILNANATPGPDLITFNIAGAGPHLIALATTLPSITERLILDATTQPGFTNAPVVRIQGGAGLGDGIVLAAGSGGSTIKGLNIFGFAAGAGILVQTDGNILQGNYLGTDVAGASAGPGNQRGLLITGSNNQVGGTTAGTANIVAFNSVSGVTVDTGDGNAIRQNGLFSNPSAIVLTNGGNNNQAAPTGLAATSTSTTTTVTGSVTSQGAGTYTVDFYAGTTSSPTDARTYLGSTTVAFLAAGTVTFTASLGTPIAVGQFVTATATSPTGDTSPFAVATGVVDPFTVTTTLDFGIGSLRQAILNANATPGLNTITIGLPSGSVIGLSSPLPLVTDPITLTPSTPVVIDGGGTVANALTFSPAVLIPTPAGSTVNGATFRNFTSTAIQVTAGAGNTFSQNTFQSSYGVTIPSSRDIVLSPGANNGVVSPVLSAATSPDPTTVVVRAILPSTTPGGNVELYRINSSVTPPTRTYLATASYPAGQSSADLAFAIASGSVTTNDKLVALITDPSNNTSAFSNVVTLAAQFVVTTTNDSGTGSLRQAILDANADTTSALVNITFNIGIDSEFPNGPPFIIRLDTALPAINRPVFLDATTQPGYDPVTGQPIVELTTAANVTIADGLVLDAGTGSSSTGSTIQGLSIYGFNNAGIRILTADNQVAGNVIGVTSTGALPTNRNNIGILISGANATGNVIGPQLDGNGNLIGAAQGRNLISGNLGDGIRISGGGDNTVVNAYIGASRFDLTNPSTSARNGGNGISIIDSNDNLVGTITFGGSLLRNVISGNAGQGVQISGASSNNAILGAFIGVDPTGEFSNSTIRNDLNGILVTGAGASANVLGISGFGNVIGGNGLAGIAIENAGTGNVVFANQIGTNVKVNGTFAVPNTGAGVSVLNSPNTIVGLGGTANPGEARNDIVGNQGAGVVLQGTTAAGSVVAGNRIVRNNGEGVRLIDVRGVTVGTTTAQNEITDNLREGIKVEYNTSSTFGVGNTIRNNWIARNRQDGILLVNLGASAFAGNLDTIQANFVGTDSTGSSTYDTNGAPLGNALDGIRLVGVPAIVSANVSSGNGLSGVHIQGVGNGISDLTGTVLLGNRLGTDITGTKAAVGTLSLGNVLDGLLIERADGVQVGGTTFNDANVISGNRGRGVEIRDTSGVGRPVRITWNYIGTDVTGTKPGDSAVAPNSFGNLAEGVFLIDSTAEIRSNVISNNRGFGIHAVRLTTPALPGTLQIVGNRIGTDVTGHAVTGPAALPYFLGNSSDGIFLDRYSAGEITDNVISGNRANGINLLQTTGVRILGNKIGTNVNGIGVGSNGLSLDLGNAGSGILLNRSDNNAIGLPGGANRNIISGNLFSGVLISGTYTEPSGASYQLVGNRLENNIIGLEAGGVVKDPNAVAGVIVTASSYNQIGGMGPGEGNLISGNRLYGVLIAGGSDTTPVPPVIGQILQPGVSTFNHVEGNLIGTDATGMIAVGNTADGVFLLNAQANTVGGDTDGARNVISGNAADGVRIFGGGSADNVVNRNYIGTNVNGNGAIPNLGNGVRLDAAGPRNRIGEASGRTIDQTPAGNLISGNGQSGVLFISQAPYLDSDGQPIAQNAVSGNRIGTDASGNAAVPNASYGVFVFSSSFNTIDGNLISGNGQSGVLIFTTGSPAWASANRLYSNRIGTNLAGNAAVPNGGNGVQIVNADDNLIGDNTDARRNVISGNAANGVEIDAIIPGSATRNTIAGNYIGTNLAGSAALAPVGGRQQQNGVLIVNASGNSVGLPRAGVPAIAGTNVPATPSNVVSGNALTGIQLTGTSSGTAIRANVIGGVVDPTTGVAGVLPAATTQLIGVYINNTGVATSGHSVGGLEAGSGNLISGGSDTIGVWIFGPVKAGVPAWNAVRGNVIGPGRTANGQGFVAAAAGNGQGVGVRVDNSANNAIGLPDQGGVLNGRNIISGNAYAGVQVLNTGSTGNVIQGNFIGTNVLGNAEFLGGRSQKNGVQIQSAAGNSVGGAVGNVISGNVTGIELQNAGQNVIQRNFIGTTPDGLSAAPNEQFGVFINNAPRAIVVGNLISANGIAGLELLDVNANNASVQDNRIGPDINGNPSFRGDGVIDVNTANGPVDFGTQKNGVVIIGASNNLIGSTSATGGNNINGNGEVGVYVARRDFNNKQYAIPTGNQIVGNQIRNHGIYGVLFLDSPNNQAPPFSGAGNPNTASGNATNFLNFLTPVNGRTSLPRPSRFRPRARR